MNHFSTADLCDENSDIQIAEPIFKMFGKQKIFMGKIRTVVAVEDLSLIHI